MIRPKDTNLPSAGCGCLIGCGAALYFCIAVLLVVACVVYQYFHVVEL